MTTGKKIIIGSVVTASVAGLVFLGLWLKKQYDKLQKNVTGFKSFRIVNLTPKQFAFEMVMTYFNNMDADVVLVDQEYDVFLNDVYATTLTNRQKTVLKSGKTSDIPLTIAFDPTNLLKSQVVNAASLLTDFKQMRVRIDMRVKVKLGILAIPISYSYEDSMKRMLGLK